VYVLIPFRGQLRNVFTPFNLTNEFGGVLIAFTLGMALQKEVPYQTHSSITDDGITA
jgi:hypothetical protein